MTREIAYRRFHITHGEGDRGRGRVFIGAQVHDIGDRGQVVDIGDGDREAFVMREATQIGGSDSDIVGVYGLKIESTTYLQLIPVNQEWHTPFEQWCKCDRYRPHLDQG